MENKDIFQLLFRKIKSTEDASLDAERSLTLIELLEKGELDGIY